MRLYCFSLWSLIALNGSHPQAKRSAGRRSKWSWPASPSRPRAGGKAEAEVAALAVAEVAVLAAAAAAVDVVVVVATMAATADTVEAAAVAAAISAIDRTAATDRTRM